jgi:hypothetical protein
VRMMVVSYGQVEGWKGRGAEETHQSFQESFARCRATRYNIPDLVFQLAELQAVRYFLRIHSYYKVSAKMKIGNHSIMLSPYLLRHLACSRRLVRDSPSSRGRL